MRLRSDLELSAFQFFKGRFDRLSNKIEACQGDLSTTQSERTPTQGYQAAIALLIWHPLATVEPKQRVTTQVVIGGFTCRSRRGCTLLSIDYASMVPTACVNPLPNHGCRETNHYLFVEVCFVSGFKRDTSIRTNGIAQLNKD